MYDLNTLYKQELNYYKNLLKLTHQLEHAAEHGKIEDLDPVFAKREKILAKISADEEDRRTLSEKANSSEQQEPAEVIEEIRKVIEEVMKMDRRIEEKLKVKKDGINDQLLRIRQGHKALKGYAPHRFIPRFLDKRW